MSRSKGRVVSACRDLFSRYSSSRALLLPSRCTASPRIRIGRRGRELAIGLLTAPGRPSIPRSQTLHRVRGFCLLDSFLPIVSKGAFELGEALNRVVELDEGLVRAYRAS